MLLQSHACHRDKNGHVEQVGDGVRAGGDGTGFCGNGSFRLQSFRERERVRAAAEFFDAADHAFRIFIREPQQGLLHLHRIHDVLSLLARRDGADGSAGSIDCRLHHPAARDQREEQEDHQE